MFIIKNLDNNLYIAINRNSGGYPYDVEIRSAHIFTKKEDAKDYADVIKQNWVLEELEFVTTETSWE